jgi:hypothetical protein
MKLLRYLFAITLVCSLSHVARADDYAMVIIDPVPLNTITTYDITTVGSPVAAAWSSCAPGELPNGSPSYDGCISFLNGTGTTLTGFDLVVPDTGGVVGQTASCPTTDPNDIFTNINCPPNPVNGDWTLTFGGGSIAAGEYFVIAEDGVPDPTTFPTTNAIGVTPEPNSFWLLSTGVLSLGFFGAYRRRETLLALRP